MQSPQNQSSKTKFYSGVNIIITEVEFISKLIVQKGHRVEGLLAVYINQNCKTHYYLQWCVVERSDDKAGVWGRCMI